MQPAAMYLIGVVSLSAIGVGGLVAIEWLRPGDYNTAIVGQMITLIGPSIIGLMILIRSTANGQALQEVRRGNEEAKSAAVAAAQNAAVAASGTAQLVESVIEKKLPAGS